MGDAYWRYAEATRQPNGPGPALAPVLGKRPHPEYDVSAGHDLPNYYGRDDDRVAPRGVKEGDSLGASYDRYLRGMQVGSYTRGEPARVISGGLSSRPIDDPRIMGIGASDLAKHQAVGVGRPEHPLPPDASPTLYVEGLPANCTRREVAHIFRPFVGYKEVRLVTKDSRHSGGDPLVLCFVDFVSPAHAATAMDALQVCYLDFARVHCLALFFSDRTKQTMIIFLPCFDCSIVTH
ncbi:protein MATERNALLY EXPRESSED GENE 5-like isoform X2 [Apium graveolens]|uniref:protein MATERNALLY EXPRESSED GENE 5-like isoform X2 n=1 Tax=Apium graveolens TaxID=4045 RepID=UPI003D7ABEA8